ncbi:cytochrome P450 1A2-like [Haliotis rufescens]|uniref:cytochrome P450 1A2-like n=1 Tax=Haliotis rufescens TaxID=6454 RepID=UPI00201F23CE|nr:cytochrome P450 1A2-like [Haliotis rufescens]
MDSSASPVKLMSTLLKSTEMQVGVVAFMASLLAMKVVKKFTSGRKPPPPGPWGFPIIGHLPLLGNEPYVTFMKMKERFGNIFQIQLGSWSAVVINGKQAIKEALHNSGEDFSGRPQFMSAQIINYGQSIGFGEYGEQWKIHRKIANKVLTEFSNAKSNPIEDMIHEEVDILVDDFMSEQGATFNPQEHIQLSIGSVIYQLCYGRQENIREDKDFADVILNSAAFTEFVSAGNPVDVMPWLRYLMPWKVKAFTTLIQTSLDANEKKISEHKTNFSSDNMRDITDRLISVSEEDSRLSKERILSTLNDVFGAGFETTASTTRWMLLLMAANPNVQRRVQEELDDVVGSGRRPSILDRGQLVYTATVLHEINRFVALAPLSLPHLTITDTNLGGYSINKNTVIFINLYSMSHDPEVWGDPHVFRPERFLDASGEINKSLLEEFLPFSTGGRKCLGESLARNEIFLFFTGILQKCSILQPPEVKEYSMDGNSGLTRQCLPYQVQVKLRT